MAREVRSNKRRKLDTPNEQPEPDIRGAFELHDLLRFRQSSTPDVKAGIDKFKAFLSSIQRNQDASDRSIQLQVLKQYCDDQSSSNKDENDLPDLISTWSFAASSNSDSILSAAPAVLAQLFRTISSELDFRDFGLSLCQTLLKRDQVQLLATGLSAPKFKEHLVSPCLRLMTEIVSFDGGTSAGYLFSRRDTVLRRLDTLLDSTSNKEDSDRRKPSIRRNAQRLLLALLKHLDSDSKIELINQGKTFHSCLRKISTDGGDIVRDQLSFFGQYIVDAALPKQTKVRFLNSGNLSLLANLYDFEEDDPEQDESPKLQSVRDTAHDFILHVCTSNVGLLLSQTGWYPVGFNQEVSDMDDSNINLGLDSPYWFDEYKTAVPVKNTSLSTFLQNRRPEKDALQAELIVKTFEIAPELVADYFSKKPKSIATPKDEVLWRNYFAFIFSIIKLPTPKHCGWHDTLPALPPPLSVVIESIFPRSMNRLLMSQCLTSNDEVLIISAARLMTIVLEKFGDVKRLFRTSPVSSSAWDQACFKLEDLLLARAPTYHDLVTALQKTPQDQLAARASILECMAKYNTTVPAATSESKFDVGPAISEIIDKLNSRDSESEKQTLLSSQLISIVEIAARSSMVRWWHKSVPTQISPFVGLIRVHRGFELLARSTIIRNTLTRILETHGIVRDSSADAVLASFEGHDGKMPKESTYLFIENCMIRVLKQPVRYMDQLEAIHPSISNTETLSLLPLCIAQQWPFVFKSNTIEDVKDVAIFTSRLFAYLKKAGESEGIINHLQHEILDLTGKGHEKMVAQIFEREDRDHIPISKPTTAVMEEPEDQLIKSLPLNLEDVFPTPPSPPTSLKGLSNWTKSDFDSELAPPVHSSRLARLFSCLSSPVEEIRLQAQQIIQAVSHSIFTSSYAEKDQIYLLLGEMLETARQHTVTAASLPPVANDTHEGDKGRDPSLPTIVTQLGVLLLTILSDPSDKMYSKANKFIMRGPNWNPLPRLIPYWVNQVLLREPEYDEPFSWEFEVNRLLEILVLGLRTSQDMELYRRSGVYERLGSLYFSPALSSKVSMKKKILHVLCNAMDIPTGSDTLITRMGQDSWLDLVIAREKGQSELSGIGNALKSKLRSTCNTSYIQRWENDRLRRLAAIVIAE